MRQSLPPCPVCGGTQAFFKGSENSHASIYIPLDFWGGITLGAFICLECRHTELRPHPGDLQYLREVVEKRGIMP